MKDAGPGGEWLECEVNRCCLFERVLLVNS
jgi:hypothetical protein